MWCLMAPKKKGRRKGNKVLEIRLNELIILVSMDCKAVKHFVL